MTGRGASVADSRSAVRDCQSIFCAGNANIEETPFFVEIPFQFRAIVWQKSFLYPDEIDVLEFETFRRMKSDQRHTIGNGLFFLLPFLVQRHFCEETRNAVGGASLVVR